MESLLYRPSAATRQFLDSYISDSVSKVVRQEPSQELDFWSARERSYFTLWLSEYVIEDPSVTLPTYKAIQAKVLNVKKGRPKRIRPGCEDVTYRLSLRHWYIDYLVAKGLSAELLESPDPVLRGRGSKLAQMIKDRSDEKGSFPDLPQPADTTPAFEPEILELIFKFEKLSGYKLPNKVYVIFTREDREAVYPFFRRHLENRDWVEHAVPCVKFEEYITLRKDPVLKKQIRRILIKEASRPVQESAAA